MHVGVPHSVQKIVRPARTSLGQCDLPCVIIILQLLLSAFDFDHFGHVFCIEGVVLVFGFIRQERCSVVQSVAVYLDGGVSILLVGKAVREGTSSHCGASLLVEVAGRPSLCLGKIHLVVQLAFRVSAGRPAAHDSVVVGGVAGFVGHVL